MDSNDDPHSTSLLTRTIHTHEYARTVHFSESNARGLGVVSENVQYTRAYRYVYDSRDAMCHEGDHLSLYDSLRFITIHYDS